MRCFVPLLLALIAVAAPLHAAERVVGRASVIDGDTIEIRGTRVRLFGIDAPEAGQTCEGADHRQFRCGQRAASVLDARIGDGVVTCEPKDTDQYGRTVAICRV
jgi:endonuclease YncB( thermonuclease family)